MAVCELVHRNLLVSETSGDVVFRDFTRDDQQMAALFEAFLRRFYAREQRAFLVSAPTLQWDAEGAPESLALLPIMRTEIVLESAVCTIVMDAKYYAVALTIRFDKSSIRAGHLYQIAAYVRHLALTRPPGREEGGDISSGDGGRARVPDAARAGGAGGIGGGGGNMSTLELTCDVSAGPSKCNPTG